MVTGEPVHRLEDAVEVLALHGSSSSSAARRSASLSARIIALHDRDAAFAEEHVLGAAQADASRAERVGQLGLVGQVGVGADAEAAALVGPARAAC